MQALHAKIYKLQTTIKLTGESDVTCYFRHLTNVFEKAGIEITRENRKEISQVIHGIVGYADCPAVWRQIKKRLADVEAGFVAELKAAWANRPVKG